MWHNMREFEGQRGLHAVERAQQFGADIFGRITTSCYKYFNMWQIILWTSWIRSYDERHFLDWLKRNTYRKRLYTYLYYLGNYFY